MNLVLVGELRPDDEMKFDVVPWRFFNCNGLSVPGYFFINAWVKTKRLCIFFQRFSGFVLLSAEQVISGCYFLNFWYWLDKKNNS